MRDAGGGIATQDYAISETLKKTVSEEIEERLIKNTLDIIILKAVKNGALSGYGIINFIHRKFAVLLSPGTIYAILYFLERKGLVKASVNQRARCYSLTEKGEETLSAILSMQNRIKTFVANIF